MKTAAIVGPRAAAIEDVEKPTASGDNVVVQVHVAPMCTEYQAFARGDLSSSLGHEAMGVVVESQGVSHGTGGVEIGDRVVAMPLLGCGHCNLCLAGWYIYCERAGNLEPGDTGHRGTMAEFISKPQHLLIPVPDDVSDHHAAMACCGLGASFGAYERLRISGPDTVLVTGLGPVGLGAVVNGVYRGARVIGVESNPYRAGLALSLGAEAVIDPTTGDGIARLRELTEDRLADFAIECSGVVVAQRMCVEGVRRMGTVAFIGNSYQQMPIVVSDDLLHRGVTLMGSWHYNLASASRLMDQIRRIPDQLNKLITHAFPLDDVQEAWETQLGGRCGKVLLEVAGVAHA